MKVPDKFKEYVWLVNVIHKYRKLSFKQINRLWLNTGMSGGVKISRTTFNRHLAAIEDIFGLVVDCDLRDGYKYHITNENVLREDSVQNWMLSTMNVNGILLEGLSLQDRILLEPVTCDDHLQTVIDAMKSRLRVAVRYKRYGTDEPKVLDFEPYCVKLFRQRWYVLGHFHRDATKEKPESDYFGIFAFDRIQDMEITDVEFEIDPRFDAQRFFKDSFGIVVGDGTEKERVVIRAYGVERYYMRDLPMHESQREIAMSEEYSDFEMRLRPTLDFKGYILSRGPQVKVLEPKELADDVRDMLMKAVERYG